MNPSLALSLHFQHNNYFFLSDMIMNFSISISPSDCRFLRLILIYFHIFPPKYLYHFLRSSLGIKQVIDSDWGHSFNLLLSYSRIPQSSAGLSICARPHATPMSMRSWSDVKSQVPFKLKCWGPMAWLAPSFGILYLCILIEWIDGWIGEFSPKGWNVL